jgi:hypothetical protein
VFCLLHDVTTIMGIPFCHYVRFHNFFTTLLVVVVVVVVVVLLVVVVVHSTTEIFQQLHIQSHVNSCTIVVCMQRTVMSV